MFSIIFSVINETLCWQKCQSVQQSVLRYAYTAVVHNKTNIYVCFFNVPIMMLTLLHCSCIQSKYPIIWCYERVDTYVYISKILARCCIITSYWNPPEFRSLLRTHCGFSQCKCIYVLICPQETACWVIKGHNHWNCYDH